MTDSDYDLFSHEFKADPFPTFADMRQDAPVYAHLAPNGSTIWYITRYDDVVTVLKDTTHFVKDKRHALPSDQLKKRSGSSIQALINENMLFSDPPDHTRLRALVNQAFTPRRIEGLNGRIQTIAASLLDVIEVKGDMDLIADFALPLPLIVITEMLGVPPADRADVCDWSQAIIAPGSRGLTYSGRKQKVRHLVDYMQGMFADRQANPADDLVTALVQAEEAGERLSEAELSSMVALLFVTGHETTVNLIGNGVLALLEHPGEMARLQAQPELLETAVEELLRFAGPVETSTTRWVGQDIVLQGQTMRRGDVVRVVLSSANRDRCCFAEPDKLDLARPDNRHLAFGHGIHYCLGAPLARLETKIALTALLDRLPGLRRRWPERPLAWRSGVLFRGLKHLHLIWGEEKMGG